MQNHRIDAAAHAQASLPQNGKCQIGSRDAQKRKMGRGRVLHTEQNGGFLIQQKGFIARDGHLRVSLQLDVGNTGQRAGGDGQHGYQSSAERLFRLLRSSFYHIFISSRILCCRTEVVSVPIINSICKKEKERPTVLGAETMADTKHPHRMEVHIRTEWMTVGASALAACLMLCDPTTAAAGARVGLTLCGRSVIPSLFGFLVLSPMLADGIERAVLYLCRHRAEKRTAALISAFAVGMLAGFPIGALTLLSQYRQGRISDADAARFLGVCTAVSPAFLIGYFGQALSQSAVLGAWMWIGQCLLCLIGFLILYRHPHGGENPTSAAVLHRLPSLSVCIREAVPRMLQICGAVIAFSVFRAFLQRYTLGVVSSFLSGFAEMTGGLGDCMQMGAGSGGGMAKVLGYSAAVIGFGGICVGMQIADAASESGIPMRQYWCQRLILGAVGGVLAAVIGAVLYGNG